MIDRVHFQECFAPGTKNAEPEPLEVPELLRPFLRSRRETAGRPEGGPVFPVLRGPRAGTSESLVARSRCGFAAICFELA
jgi:hypothetical protein